TFARIWNSVGFTGKMKVLMSIIYSIFSNETITEEELEKMKSKDMLNSMLTEFSTSFPKLKEPLIDERDQYLAQKIKEAPGEKVVAVLGAAHVPGIKKQIYNDHNIEKLSQVPPKSKIPKIIGWTIPIFIIALIVFTFVTNKDAALAQVMSWILWNGSLAALGTLIAFGHPLAVLTAFVAAPITSLEPFLAAGWFAGFVQAYFKRPSVEDFEKLSDDVHSI